MCYGCRAAPPHLTRDYSTSKKWKFNSDLGCENDAALLTYTFNKECSIYLLRHTIERLVGMDSKELELYSTYEGQNGFIFKIFLCSKFVVAPAYFIECVRQQRGVVFTSKIRI